MYIETSGSLPVGSYARLLTPFYKGTTGSCLEFFYHMKGKTIGTLNVYVKFFGMTKVWSKSGNQSNVWNKAQVAITSRFGYQVGLFFILFFSLLLFWLSFHVTLSIHTRSQAYTIRYSYGNFGFAANIENSLQQSFFSFPYDVIAAILGISTNMKAPSFGSLSPGTYGTILYIIPHKNVRWRNNGWILNI